MLPGNMMNSANVAAAATVLIVVGSGAQVTWLSRAYGISIAVALLLRIGVNAHLRRTLPEPRPFRVPAILQAVVAIGVGVSTLTLILSGDGPTLIGFASVCILGVVLGCTRKYFARCDGRGSVRAFHFTRRLSRTG
jgi:hypothetical protein